jgi:hypothetical protein
VLYNFHYKFKPKVPAAIDFPRAATATLLESYFNLRTTCFLVPVN